MESPFRHKQLDETEIRYLRSKVIVQIAVNEAQMRQAAASILLTVISAPSVWTPLNTTPKQRGHGAREGVEVELQHSDPKNCHTRIAMIS
jgi:hypothetical protein